MRKKTVDRSKPAPPSAAVRFVGERVRQLREARGYSQEALAARAKVSPKFVGEIERAASNVSVAILWQLCGGLGVSMSEFFMTADGAASDDAAVASAIVGSQPPAMRRRVLRILRAVVDE